MVYGLTNNIDGDSVAAAVLHEYQSLWRDIRSAATWGDRWRYLCLAPGWSHAGPDKRARTLRRQLQAG